MKTFICHDHGVVNVVAIAKIFFRHNHDIVDVVAISNRGKSFFFSSSRSSECSSAEMKKI